jgi:hypothetical protein
MGLGGLALAAVLLLAWTGGSTAFPLIPLQGCISLQSQDSIEAVRWRHRHRGYAWGEQGDDTGGTARSFTAETPPPLQKLSRPTLAVATTGALLGWAARRKPRPDRWPRSYWCKSFQPF